jgi:hypothetical protein
MDTIQSTEDQETGHYDAQMKDTSFCGVVMDVRRLSISKDPTVPTNETASERSQKRAHRLLGPSFEVFNCSIRWAFY